MAAHALLSASSSHRWLNCTPSARLEEQLPDTSGEAAAKGTLAHAIAELKVRKWITPMSVRKFNAAMKPLREDPLYEEEMQRCTDDYLDYLKEINMSYDIPPYIAAEVKLDYSHIAPEGYGTSDCIIIGGDTLHIVDYKHGQGVLVAAEDNPQMKLYGLGALKVYAPIFGSKIQKVKLHIFQPRAGGASSWKLTREELETWGQEIKPTAELAYKGEGEYAAGDWCKFCRANATCRGRAKSNTALEDFGFAEPPILSDAEVGDILQRAIHLEDWIKALKDYALQACLAGKEIPGWKAVERQGNRAFTDQDAAFEVLKANGYPETILYERKPLTLAAVEKLIKKKEFDTLLGTFVTRPPASPVLAPESDKRPPFRQDAAADFAEVAANG